jgi:hypothetical protein
MLIGRGLTAWIRIALTSRPLTPVPCSAPSHRPAVPDGLQTDLLHVWMQMALTVQSVEVS